jgi:hypothetical protein
VTTAPIAFTVHDGHSRLASWRRQLIAAWLTANDIRPDDVSTTHAITILTVPFRPPETTDDGEPWLVQVISLRQYYVNHQGSKEQNLITRQPVTFHRTVPLKVPFPADTTTADEGTRHGEADRQEPEEAPQEVVRSAREEGVSDPRQGARTGSAVPGEAARNEGAAEDGSRRGDEAVPQPEEDRRRPEEEVGDA